MINIENISGFFAFITSNICLFPQIYKSYKTKSTKDISIIMLLVFLLCSLSWIVNGIVTKSKYVVYSNIVSVFFICFSIGQKIVYDKRNCTK